MTTSYDFAAMTRDEALDVLASLDAAKWGEQEREESKRLNARKSRGLLINAIVHHQMHDYGDAIDTTAKKIAKKQLTADDKAELRKGG